MAKKLPTLEVEQEAEQVVEDKIDSLIFARAGAEPRSQKAIGIRGLGDIIKKKMSAFPAMAVPPHFLVQDPSDLDSKEWLNHELHSKDRLFVRPCPTVPRHGFVESREIKGNGEAAGLVSGILREAREADEGSEVLISEPIDCKFSAIWTPDCISFGNGNDGATSGDTFLHLTLPGTNPYADIQQEYGIKEEDRPYIELLISKDQENDAGKLMAVQFRGGPATGNSGPNIIPDDTLVMRAFEATGSLMDHEKLVLSLKPGDVVYRLGDSPISHYAAHCVQHKIPYITDHVPVVGEFLAKSSDIPEFDIPSLRRGLIEGFNIKIANQNSLNEIGKMCVIVTHYSQFFRTGDSAVALGRFCALLIRISAVLCLNETKYCHSVGNDEIDKLKEAVKDYPEGRESVYMGHVNKPMVVRALLRRALDCFMYGSWGGGYGGLNWGNCSIHAVELDNLVASLLDTSVDDDVYYQSLAGRISTRMHSLVNACHNGGKLLTKIISNSFLDKAASGDTKMPLEYLMRYAQSVWEKQKTGFLPKDTVIYNPTPYGTPNKPAARCEKYWEATNWMSKDDAMELKKEEMGIKPKPVVVKEPPAPYVPEFDIRAQVRFYQGDQYRIQVRWNHLNIDDMPVNEKITVKDVTDLYPDDYPLALKKGPKHGDDEDEDGDSPNYLGNKEGNTENTLSVSGVPSELKEKILNEAVLPSNAGTDMKYYPMSWEWVDEIHAMVNLSVDGVHMGHFSTIMKSITY